MAIYEISIYIYRELTVVSSLGVLFYSSATPHRVCVSLDPHSQDPFMEAAERARDRGEGRCVPAHWLWRAHRSSSPQKGQQRKCTWHFSLPLFSYYQAPTELQHPVL